jgi:hypothetical protein
MTIKLGNLLPGQTATLKSQIISQLEVSAGHYTYSLPSAFFPDYKKHGVKDNDIFNYEFSSQIRILSDAQISNLIIPESTVITD